MATFIQGANGKVAKRDNVQSVEPRPNGHGSKTIRTTVLLYCSAFLLGFRGRDFEVDVVGVAENQIDAGNLSKVI